MINFFQTHFIFFIFLVTLLGLCMGSFLNVVIYRLPKMLIKRWEKDFQTSESKIEELSIDLIKPASHCPACKKRIPFYLNIPVVGYFLARGKCKYCKQTIPVTYPIVEILSGFCSALIAWKWGINWETLGALIFTWLLLPLIFIDLKHHLLPDILTLLGIWLGLAFNLLNIFTPIEDAVIGTIAGYLSLWIIAKLFHLIKKKEGIGYGDFKLLSMLGAWQGWQDLPFILLQACVLGLIVAITRLLLKKQKFDTPIAFGPFLAISGWITLFFEKKIESFYQSIFVIVLGW